MHVLTEPSCQNLRLNKNEIAKYKFPYYYINRPVNDQKGMYDKQIMIQEPCQLKM